MRNQISSHLTYLCLGALWLIIARPASAQNATFTYQGRLTQAGNPATGGFDMQFKLFDAPDVGKGTQRGYTKTNPTVPVANGVFTVSLDFGAAVFDGSPRFLEIGVRPAGNASPYNVLAPRQQVTSVPYAIHSLSAAQLDGHSSTSFIQVDNNGNVGIGAPAPATDVKLLVNGNTRMVTGGSGGYLQIGTPNGETGLGALGKNRFDLRFNDNTLTLAAGPGLGSTLAHNGVTMNTNGNVGIGMESPLLASQWKLEVNGPFRLKPSPNESGSIEFSKPNGETGMSIVGANRADVRFDGSSLKLTAGSGSGAPPAENGIVITTGGKVGVGVPSTNVDPNIKLEARSANGIALFGRSGFEGVHGESSSAAAAAVAGFNLSSGPGVYGKSATGSAIHADGNATQAREKGGFVKAMAYIRGDAKIIRCYNSQKAGAETSTAPCGIGCRIDGFGRYRVTFGFSVQDRFVMVQPDKAPNVGRGFHKSAGIEYLDVNEIAVTFWTPDSGDSKSDGAELDEFTIFVF